MSAERIAKNPFYVLELPVTAGRADIERQGQKLLGMLELGLKQAASYRTPLGSFPRTAEQIREAMADLRDPDRRLAHELWASLPAAGAPPAAPGPKPAPAELAPWPEALDVLGWRPR